MKGTCGVLCASVLVFLGLLSISFTQLVSATVPAIQHVKVFDVGGSTYLNITVWHTPESQSHYVDLIEVIMGSNTTNMTIGVQPLGISNTFIITYDLGPVIDTPTVTVRAHCIVDGWSTANWTGTVPEFPVTLMAFLLVALASLAIVLLKKSARVRFTRET